MAKQLIFDESARRSLKRGIDLAVAKIVTELEKMSVTVEDRSQIARCLGVPDEQVRGGRDRNEFREALNDAEEEGLEEGHGGGSFQ